MAITPLPPAPEPTDSTAQFNTKAFAWVASLDDFVTEANATAVAVTASQTSASNSSLSAAAAAADATNQVVLAANQVTLAAGQVALATDQADASATSAETAAAATNAVLWVSGTTYAIGFLVYSPLDNRAYRRLTAGAGTTDPSLDATNWVQLTRVVEQSDIGTAPNEVPLNQYLGNLAYQSSESAIIESGRIDLKGGGSNLLTFSEQFSNVAWIKNAVTVINNGVIAPNGNLIGSEITGNGATALHALSKNFSIPTGVVGTVSVYAKSNTVNFLQIFSGASGDGRANFDIANGTVESFSGVFSDLSITDAGSGWYRCSVKFTNATNATLFIGLISSATSVRGESWATSGSLYLWGAQLEQSSTVGNYIATEATAITLENASGATALSVIPTTGFDTTYPLAFELASNTSLIVKVKGSDGTVRSATLTLA